MQKYTFSSLSFSLPIPFFLSFIPIAAHINVWDCRVQMRRETFCHGDNGTAVCDKWEALKWPHVSLYYPFVEFLPLVTKQRSVFTRQSSCQATKKKGRKRNNGSKG